MFTEKIIIRPKINLKLVSKFQVFCYTIKCTTLLRLPKSYTSLWTSSVLKQSKITMGYHFYKIHDCFVPIMHL